MARRRMKRQKPELRRALAGRLTAAQRWVLTELLDQYERVEAAISPVEEKIREEVERAADPFVGEAIKLMDMIPGVGETVAQTIASEIGVEMEHFPTDKHLSSWAGMCPGNEESAGKRWEREEAEGESLLAGGADPSSVGGQSAEGNIPSGAVSAIGEADGEEKSARGGRTFDPGDRLSCPAEPHQL